MKQSSMVCVRTSMLTIQFAGALLISLGACSPTRRHLSSEFEPGWMKDGQIVISRPAPRILDGASPSSEQVGTPRLLENLLGFMPIRKPGPPQCIGRWLSIDRSAQRIKLMHGETALQSVFGRGIERLRPGLYELMHKQMAPLWHAPDSYFLARGLAVPPPGDRARLLRGALGELALFLSHDTPLHSGPIWSEEIGGVRLSQADLAKIYYALQIGSRIEVQ